MVPPDRGKAELALGDDKPPLVLWFPLGALRLLSEKAGFDVPLSDATKFIHELLTPQTAALFVWAGRLWEERGLKLEDVQQLVEWCPRPPLEIAGDIRTALIRSMSGADPEVRKTRTKNPPQATAMNGAGSAHSSSP